VQFKVLNLGVGGLN